MKLISFRYMAGKSKGRISFKITVACLIGIFIGTSFLVIALSIGSGYEVEIKKNIVDLFTHGQVRQYLYRKMTGYDTLKLKIMENENIISAAPFLSENVAIEVNNNMEFVLLFGVEEEYLFETSNIHEKIYKGSCTIDSTKSDRNRFQKSIIIGGALAEKMNIDTGMEVFLGSLLSGDIGSAGNQSIMRFAVSGIFETGMYEYDLNIVFISLSSAQNLLHSNGASGIMIKTDDFMNVDEIFEKLISDIGGYPHTFHTYKSQNKPLFQWIRIQKYLIACILFFIIFIAAFNIISSQIMMVMEKRNEIGILKALGMKKRAIIKIFVFNGFLFGFIGSTLGFIFGLLVCYFQSRYNIITIAAEVYLISKLPVKINLVELLIMYFFINSICVISTLIPARIASKVIPADSIRCEVL